MACGHVPHGGVGGCGCSGVQGGKGEEEVGGEGKEGACCVIRMHVYSCLQHLGFAHIRDEVCGPMEMLNILCETSLKFCCAL